MANMRVPNKGEAVSTIGDLSKPHLRPSDDLMNQWVMSWKDGDFGVLRAPRSGVWYLAAKEAGNLKNFNQFSSNY